jgi:hypothetical protein
MYYHSSASCSTEFFRMLLGIEPGLKKQAACHFSLSLNLSLDLLRCFDR